MKITEHTPSGMSTRNATTTELKDMAKLGNKEAIKELIELRGGWSALTALQKEKVTRLLFGDAVDL